MVTAVTFKQLATRGACALAVALAIALALALVFAAYLKPDVAFTLATQLWQCL